MKIAHMAPKLYTIIKIYHSTEIHYLRRKECNVRSSLKVNTDTRMI